MPRFIDMLQCGKCGTWHVPKFTTTGRIEPHCLDLPTHKLPCTGKLPEHTGKLPECGQIIDVTC